MFKSNKYVLFLELIKVRMIDFELNKVKLAAVQVHSVELLGTQLQSGLVIVGFVYHLTRGKGCNHVLDEFSHHLMFNYTIFIKNLN